jgi:UDP-glucose 4,6-dehydratase
LDLIRYIFETEEIDTVLHFAAQSHVDNSFGNSIAFTSDNVLGTHVLLEACRLFSGQVKRFIHVSSDEVYGQAPLGDEFKGSFEIDPLAPTNPYAATKAAAEFLVKAYHASFKIPIIISRGNNVYGPRQYPEKLIPKFIHLLERDLPCPLHGGGTNLRSFVYVDDVVKAFEIILSFGVVGEIYNIGTPFEISTRDVFDTLVRLFGKQSQHEHLLEYVRDRPFNDIRYRIDTSKLEKLGWKATVAFEEGLQATIDWYKENPNYFGEITPALSPHPRMSHSKILSSDSIASEI